MPQKPTQRQKGPGRSEDQAAHQTALWNSTSHGDGRLACTPPPPPPPGSRGCLAQEEEQARPRRENQRHPLQRPVSSSGISDCSSCFHVRGSTAQSTDLGEHGQSHHSETQWGPTATKSPLDGPETPSDWPQATQHHRQPATETLSPGSVHPPLPC